MSDKKENTKSETKNSNTATKKDSPSCKVQSKGGTVQNGKGDSPRNCFSEGYRSNFDGINWNK